MEKIEDLTGGLFKEKLKYKTDIVQKLCDDMDINTEDWFEYFTEYLVNYTDYTIEDVLKELIQNFMFYLTEKIEKELKKYIEPDIHPALDMEPYIFGVYQNLDLRDHYRIDKNNNFILKLKKKKRKEFKKLLDQLTLDQKCELLENKICYYIIQEKFNFFSEKEIRYLKLKKLKN